MKCRLMSLILVLPVLSASLVAQTPSSRPSVLHLLNSVDLPGFSGDFDHFEVDLKHHRLFLAAEDHHTIEVFDLATGARKHSITGLGATHSILYLPESDKVVITDGDGFCRVFSGKDYTQLGALQLHPGADSIGYDAPRNLLYVVNGGRDAHMQESYLSVVDLATLKKVRELKIDANHVEAMALDDRSPRIWINITDRNEVWTIDRNSLEVTKKWPVTAASENSPMALDTEYRRLFVICRKPARFVVFDTETGRIVTAMPTAGKSDGIAFDRSHKRVFVPGGEGYISIYRATSPDTFELVENVPSAAGAKTALLVPELNRFYVAVSPGEGKFGAKVLTYSVAAPLAEP